MAVRNKNKTFFLWATLLSGALFMSPVFAEGEAAGCTTCDLVTQMTDLKALLTEKDDIKRSEMAQSIINYLAQTEQDRYTLMVMWHTEAAPGTDLAMETGQYLGKLAYGQSVIDQVGDTLVNTIGVSAQSGTPEKNAQAALYEKLRNYFNTALKDPEQADKKREALSTFNFSTLYQKTNIRDDTEVRQMIQTITNTAPRKISIPNESDSEAKEAIASLMIEKATTGVGLNTFMDMLANRKPNAEMKNKSMLEIMEDESTWRMEKTEWFTNISTSSQEAVIKEIAQMMAFNLWMNYQQYRQNEQMAAMLAASLASQARLATIMENMTKQLASGQADQKAAEADAKARDTSLEQE